MCFSASVTMTVSVHGVRGVGRTPFVGYRQPAHFAKAFRVATT
jgi:hypothetical protein